MNLAKHEPPTNVIALAEAIQGQLVAKQLERLTLKRRQQLAYVRLLAAITNNKTPKGPYNGHIKSDSVR
jgi:hypothetical protein